VALRIALAEDSYIVREGIEQVLRGDEDIEIVASCADMPSLLAAVDADPPDVVLTDIRMPPEGDDAGIQIAARLRESHPAVGVVVCSEMAAWTPLTDRTAAWASSMPAPHVDVVQ